jgi:hypothetical protein
MTSLQQTAMLGGAASAKTASYTLVAADAGTAITMSNASATTITVNTALFAAGDTVNITNLGAGVCTITAGTATVNTSATLALAQYESGTLDFTSTSAAIFIKGAGAAAGGGANWSLVNAGGTALTGATTITVSGISAADKILIFVNGGVSSASASSVIRFRLNADSGANYYSSGWEYTSNTSYSVGNLQSYYFDSTSVYLGKMAAGAASTGGMYALLSGCNASGKKVFNCAGGFSDDAGTGGIAIVSGGFYDSASTISSVSLISSVGNFDRGTLYIYTSA